MSQRPAAARTKVARTLDLSHVSLLVKRLRLIPRGAGHSRAPIEDEDAAPMGLAILLRLVLQDSAPDGTECRTDTTGLDLYLDSNQLKSILSDAF